MKGEDWASWDPRKQVWDDTYVLRVDVLPDVQQITLLMVPYYGMIEVIFHEVESARVNLRLQLEPTWRSYPGEIETGYPVVKTENGLTELTIVDLSNPPVPILRLKYARATVREIQTMKHSPRGSTLEGLDTFEFEGVGE